MRHARIDGVALEYDIVPPGRVIDAHAPTLVFLHEGLGSATHWRDFPARVAEGTGLVAMTYSRAGYGGSDPVSLPRPMDYMQHEGEVVLPALLDAVGVKQAVLVGHSDGASIALVYAGGAHGRARVRALVAIAPHVFCEDVSVASIATIRDEFEHGPLLRKRLARHHGANTDGAFRGWCDAWLDPRFRAWNIESYVRGIVAPTLLVQGRDDAYGTLAQLDAIERGLGAGVEVERVVLDKSGHAPQRDAPDATLAAIVDFVQRTTG